MIFSKITVFIYRKMDMGILVLFKARNYSVINYCFIILIHHIDVAIRIQLIPKILQNSGHEMEDTGHCKC